MNFIYLLEYPILFFYTLCMFLLLIYSLGQVHLMWISRHLANSIPKNNPVLDKDMPFVTVQLPIYNERYVIERLLKSVTRLDYPKERLEIQLLDDSNDETSAIAARCLTEFVKLGIDIKHIRRENRCGFKAGALAYGLNFAKGELIAIFDADFVPQADFLRQTIGYFNDKKIAAVQVQWGHLNEHTSVLTKIQAFLLSLHFGFEQPRRWVCGLFMNFNGTCGIWRREAIQDAGGWSSKTLTEDIDLSYRAQLKGWRFVYLKDYQCPGELPEEMSGLRSQQYRWMKGGAENARLHLGTVLRAPLPGHIRAHAAHHLLAGSVYLVILCALLLSVPLTLLKNTAISYNYVDFGIPFVTSTIALFFVFYVAQTRVVRGYWITKMLYFVGKMLLFLVFTMGLSVHNGLAVLSGWLGRKTPFIRTPKFGDSPWVSTAYVQRKPSPQTFYDLAMLLFLLFGIAAGWVRGEYAFFPIQSMAIIGLFWIIILSLIHPIKAGRSQQNLPATSLEGASNFSKVKNSDEVIL